MLTQRVELEPQKEVGIPALPGCIFEGETLDEALDNIRDAIEDYLKVMTKHCWKIPLEFSEFQKVEVLKKSKRNKVRTPIHA